MSLSYLSSGTRSRIPPRQMTRIPCVAACDILTLWGLKERAITVRARSCRRDRGGRGRVYPTQQYPTNTSCMYRIVSSPPQVPRHGRQQGSRRWWRPWYWIALVSPWIIHMCRVGREALDAPRSYMPCYCRSVRMLSIGFGDMGWGFGSAHSSVSDALPTMCLFVWIIASQEVPPCLSRRCLGS